ncbi:MAG: YdiY family protein [Gammaproteobacteria bacterium]
MSLYHTLPRAAAALLGLTLAQVASADTIHMKGGDRLSGTIVDKQGDKLTLKTAYSNEAIVVLWSEVASVETEQPAKFMLKDRTVLTAQAAPGANETVVLKSGTTITTAPVALAEVDYINPPPYVTGEGVATAGRANLGLTMNRGNTDNNQLFYDAETVIRSIKNRFTIGALGVQKQEDGEETARNNRAYFKYDHFLTDKWYAYANTDVQEDKFKDLNLRTTLGVGSGYQYFDTKEKSLSLEGGLTYVDNDYDLAEDDNYAAGRWALKYAQYLFGGATQFFHEHEGLVSLEAPDDTIIRAQTGFRFPLVENLSATLQYNVDWQNNPPPGFDSTDSAYIVIVGYLCGARSGSAPRLGRGAGSGEAHLRHAVAKGHHLMLHTVRDRRTRYAYNRESRR